MTYIYNDHVRERERGLLDNQRYEYSAAAQPSFPILYYNSNT